MRYSNVISGTFLERPNRFIAKVEIDGRVETCHVKNTGRCREILEKGCRVILSVSDNPDRKTAYDLVAAYKGSRLINIDSQVPNAVVEECLPSLGLIKGLRSIKREVTYGNSRFDIFCEADRPTFVEVKGVTLENDGVVLFPDAPTERGVKHLKELIQCVKDGYDAYLFLLVQMSDVEYFTPNYDTHEEFGTVLKDASDNGVRIIAYDCAVEEDSIKAKDPVRVVFRE